jgi:outer membrane lipoprotein
VKNAKQYIGETVIVGGHVVEVQNKNDQTLITAVQAPLGVRQEPKPKDQSQGRLILVYPGFLDPKVYTEHRKITVAGKLLGSSQIETDDKPFPYLRVKVSEIHLWSVARPRYVDPYWNYGWWPYYHPYPFWWRHPYYWD